MHLHFASSPNFHLNPRLRHQGASLTPETCVPLFSYISPDAPSFLGREKSGARSQKSEDSRRSLFALNLGLRTRNLVPEICHPLFSYKSPDAPSFCVSRFAAEGWVE